MTISDKTRKILWAKSGNKCAFCKQTLIFDGTEKDPQSIVAEECHICSGKELGPRFDKAFPPSSIDEIENLILLCRIHHKLIDDQPETYTREILSSLKANHERWVFEKLAESPTSNKPRIRKTKAGQPEYLFRLTGKKALDIIVGAEAHLLDHDEVKNELEADAVGGFLQNIKDWGEIGSDLEPIQKVNAGLELDKQMKDMESLGFIVFGGIETRILEGGEGPSSRWRIALVNVLRKENPSIVLADIESLVKNKATGNSNATGEKVS